MSGDVRVVSGIPAAINFSLQAGSPPTSPLIIDSTTNKPYYLNAGVVTALAGSAATVSSVSVVTANGVSGTVATPTTTPAITLTLGAITPASVAATGAVSGTQLTSTVAIGTAPLVVTSTTQVANLNVATSGTCTGNAATATSAAKWTTARNLAGNSVDGSANVTFANKFIVQGTADTGLSAAQFTGALATGIVKNTTTTGVLSIAVNSDLPAMSATVGGAVPTPPNDATKYLDGTGSFSVPPGTGPTAASAATTLAGTDTTQFITAGGFAGNKSLVSTAGYYKLPGGWMVQWVNNVLCPTSATTDVNFAVSFPTAAVSVSVTDSAAVATGALSASTLTTSKVSVGNLTGTNMTPFIIAIGY